MSITSNNGTYFKEKLESITEEVLELKKSIDSLASSIDDNTQVVSSSAKQVADSIEIMGKNAGRLLDIRLVVLILFLVFGANIAVASTKIFTIMMEKWLVTL